MGNDRKFICREDYLLRLEAERQREEAERERKAGKALTMDKLEAIALSQGLVRHGRGWRKI